MKTKKTTTKTIIGCMMFLLMINIASAGFASTYLPKIDGTPTLVLMAGETQSYFIYPQNSGEESMFIKIEVVDEDSLIKNILEDSYEILPHTMSDSFPIELKIHMPLTAKQGDIFSIEYSVSSTQETSDRGMVNFNPTGYSKTINVQVQDIKMNLVWWIVGIAGFLVLMIIGGVIYGIKKKSKKF